MSYKPSKCPDCKSNVQMCCCQAWDKNSQSEIHEYEDKWLYQRIEELENQVHILREALERIVNYQESRPWANRDKIAREALQKVGGKG